MKAIAYDNYGSPDVLECRDLEKPVPGGDEVLIKVRAASLNPLDRGELKGVPYIFASCSGCASQRPRGPAGQVLTWLAWWKRLAGT